MAVYTVLNHQTIADFIAPYGIGALIAFEGVAAGVENTNYFIRTDRAEAAASMNAALAGQYVLTIFESVAMEDLAFYVSLTTRLYHRTLPVPCPLADRQGEAVHQIDGKPAILVPRIRGEHPAQPTIAQCRAIGDALARCHLACRDWPVSRQSIRSLTWLKRTAEHIAPELYPEEVALLDELPRFERAVSKHPDLPQAVIHGDLFRDNTLFAGDKLTALLDFYSAGHGFLLMDLAVVINDWCSRADGSLDESLATAVLSAYRALRPLTGDEHQLWNHFLRIAALRFWISRRHSQLHPELSHRPGGLVVTKDPERFRTILWQRIRHPHRIDATAS